MALTGLEYIALAGLVVSAAGTGASIRQQRIAQQNARKAEIKQEQQNELAARRERLQAIRQGRRQRAQALNAAITAGAAGTGSSSEGGIAQVTGAQNAEVGFVNQSLGLVRDISGFNQNIAQAESRSQLFQLGASIGSGITDNAGTIYDGIELFKGP